MVFKYTNCYYCVKLVVRTVNVLEKIESPCVDLEPHEEPTVERVCRNLNPDKYFITLFAENFVPVSIKLYIKTNFKKLMVLSVIFILCNINNMIYF